MRYHIVTLGCPKNEVDSEMMGALLRSAGHGESPTPRRADVVIVNTCSFVRDARDESYGALRELAARKRPGQFLVAAGCLAQRYADVIYQQVPGVDAVLGTQSWPRITEVLRALAQEPRDHVTIAGPADMLVTSVHRRPGSGASAYLKIADGCSASCAFCAIPLIKGRQRSKPPEEILREARELAAQGVREIVLIAQNTTAWGRDLGLRDALPGLLEALSAQAPAAHWLRILYAYPQDVSPRTIAAMASLPSVCHYLDLPLQHAHPDVLRRMGRPSDVDAVHRLLSDLRTAMPDVALRTTFIVGYPGETEAEFEALLAFMAAERFDKVGIFAYSREDGTHAAALPDQVPVEVTAQRYERAMQTQQSISLTRNVEQVGRTLEVLLEGSAQGLSVGRSYRDAPEIDGLVLIPGEKEPGQFVQARVTGAQEYDLVAEILLTRPGIDVKRGAG